MKEKKAADIESRIRAVAAEAASITEFAEGSVKKAYSTYPVKGGGRRKSKTPQYKFQTRGGRGRQKVVHIPAGQVARVRELLENGRRYRKLEAEYSRLVTEAALAGLKKKDGCRGFRGRGSWACSPCWRRSSACPRRSAARRCPASTAT